MMDRNSWVLPGNGILGGVILGSGIPRPGDPNSEYEVRWARALREALETQLGGDADRLATVGEPVRAGASHTGLVDPIANSIWQGIEYLRQPAPPPQMSQERMIGPGPYLAPRPDEMDGGIGRAIIQHYADYFDPWTYDAQGRRVIDTPAAYTPNAAMKLPPTQNPWWMPIVGGFDLASNFVVPGVGAGARGAFTISRAAAVESGLTGTLLGAIREGQLANLAGEGAGGATGARRGAASAMDETSRFHLLGGADGNIFRSGGSTPSNLTPRPVDKGDLSFRDSLSNPYPIPMGQRPALAPGKEYMQFDSSKLPLGSVIFDNDPPGHVGVQGVSPTELKKAIIGRGKFPR